MPPIVIAILLVLLVLAVVVVAVIIIDKTFTGEAAQFAWIAKIVVGILALAALLMMLFGGYGPMPSVWR